jgi:hypothetical protein
MEPDGTGEAQQHGAPIPEDQRPRCRKVATGMCGLRRYVYNRHQESGKDVIPHQTYHGCLPKQTPMTQAHDLQNDERYVLSTLR